MPNQGECLGNLSCRSELEVKKWRREWKGEDRGTIGMREREEEWEEKTEEEEEMRAKVGERESEKREEAGRSRVKATIDWNKWSLRKNQPMRKGNRRMRHMKKWFWSRFQVLCKTQYIFLVLKCLWELLRRVLRTSWTSKSLQTTLIKNLNSN